MRVRVRVRVRVTMRGGGEGEGRGEVFHRPSTHPTTNQPAHPPVMLRHSVLRETRALVNQLIVGLLFQTTHEALLG